MSESTKHDVIYLQGCDEQEGGYSWSAEKITEKDVKYIRADLVEARFRTAIRADLTQREQQLAQAQMYALGKKLLLEEKEKQIVILRDALESANSALEFSSHGAVKAIHKALEATQDLSGLVLCEAEPVAWSTFDGEGGYDYRSYIDNEDYRDRFRKRNPTYFNWVEPLYKARKP